jgi:hypothetical protein
MCATAASQPALAVTLTVSEFDDRRWRKDELLALARLLSIPVKGSKAELVARIRITLVRRSMIATPEVHVGAAATTAASNQSSRAATSLPARDFFRAAPGESRSKALAAWYASRSGRKS